MFKRLVVGSAAAIVIAAIGCGGSDPGSKCQDVQAVLCEKLFSCYTMGAELDAVKQEYGPGVGDCRTKLIAATCHATTNGASACANGAPFDVAKADQCITDIRTPTCEKLVTMPTSCATLCAK